MFVDRALSIGGSAAATVFVTALVSVATAQPALTNLGVLPGGTASRANAVSADGVVVAGYSGSSSGDRAFRWTSTGGMQDLGTLSGGSFSYGYAISGDGMTVVGLSSSSNGARAFRSVNGGSMQSLGNFGGGGVSVAYAASGNGGIIAGYGSGAGNNFAFRWMGVMTGIGVLPGGTYSYARALNSDGSMVAGYGSSTAGERAFRWKSGSPSVMLDLGVLPGGTRSQALAMSGDGSVVVGWGTSSLGVRAFRWVDDLVGDGDMSDLGSIPGSTSAYGNAVSGDGSVVAGTVTIGAEYRAFVWTAAEGMLDLNELLASLGVDTTGWTLNSVDGLSFDGSTLVGLATVNGQQRAWLLTGLVPACQPPTITLDPVSAVACFDGRAAFRIATEGEPSGSFEWQVEDPPGSWLTVPVQPAPLSSGGWVSAANPNSAEAFIRLDGTAGPLRVRCVASNSCGDTVSETAMLSVCRADWNCADGLDSQDYFDFLDGFFVGSADFNGADGTDSQDYFEFLEAFFSGCPAE